MANQSINIVIYSDSNSTDKYRDLFG